MKKLSAVLAVLLAAAIVFCGVTISQKNKLDELKVGERKL